ncbi:MAG: hypothetical protein KGI08_10470 [Thaumarchaeota archaeon]|nr:hypothetical protein [Nitrososphaerota archaeon]
MYPDSDGFHYANGVFFKRLPDGSVRITIKATAQHNETRIKEQITIDKDSWGSIVSAVSALGEDAYSFKLARKFHDAQIEHDVLFPKT